MTPAVRGWILTAHLVGTIGWLGGLVMLVRVLRYHASEPPSVRLTLSRLEARIDWFVAIPNALVAIVAGLVLVRLYGMAWFRHSLWLHAKLGLVLVLMLVHLGVSRRRLRLGKADPNTPLSASPLGVVAFAIFLLSIAIVALAIHRPMVGGG